MTLFNTKRMPRDVCPCQALGLLQAAVFDRQPAEGRVCYPVCQFRCLLAETGSGMHVLGKGLLVIDEAGQIEMLISI